MRSRFTIQTSKYIRIHFRDYYRTYKWNYSAGLDAFWDLENLHIHQFARRSVRVLNPPHHLTYELHVTFRDVFHFTCEFDVQDRRRLYNRVFGIVCWNIGFCRRRDRYSEEKEATATTTASEKERKIGDGPGQSGQDGGPRLRVQSRRKRIKNDSGNLIRRNVRPRVIPVQSQIPAFHTRAIKELPSGVAHSPGPPLFRYGATVLRYHRHIPRACVY